MTPQRAARDVILELERREGPDRTRAAISRARDGGRRGPGGAAADVGVEAGRQDGRAGARGRVGDDRDGPHGPGGVAEGIRGAGVVLFSVGRGGGGGRGGFGCDSSSSFLEGRGGAGFQWWRGWDNGGGQGT
ncbi:hypothetical protein PG985_011003 [Apiospora marii]|uniref:Uncharacterized protein n=1 Tax=Apiospora marii TaxID=335849 RepID=A0ABR1SSF3_9PEZI